VLKQSPSNVKFFSTSFFPNNLFTTIFTFLGFVNKYPMEYKCFVSETDVS